MPNYKLYWLNESSSGCFECFSASTKEALTESIKAGIPSLDWVEIWEDLGDRWRVENLKGDFSQRFVLKYVVSGKQYVNKKTQGVYEVVFLCSHTETAESMVVYIPAHACWRSKLARLIFRWAVDLLWKDERIWVRPLESFEEKFCELD